MLFSQSQHIRAAITLTFCLLLCSCVTSPQTDTKNTRQAVLSLERLPQTQPLTVRQPVIGTSSKGPTNITRNLFQDRVGDFWFPNWEGLFRYDGTTFTQYTFPKDDKRQDPFFSACQLSDGHLWFGTLNTGIFIFDGTSFTQMTQAAGLPSNRIYAMTQDKSGHIWIGTDGGVSRYTPSLIAQGTFTHFTTQNGLPGDKVFSILQDKTGKVWFGTHEGVGYFDGITIQSLHFPDGSKMQSGTGQIIESASGDIWLGSYDGLYRYGKAGLTLVSEMHTDYLLEDHNGDLWLSAVDPTFETYTSLLPPMSLYRYDGTTMTKYLTKSEGEDCQVFDLLEDQSGKIWFGTTQGVARFDPRVFPVETIDYFR